MEADSAPATSVVSVLGVVGGDADLLREDEDTSFLEDVVVLSDETKLSDVGGESVEGTYEAHKSPDEELSDDMDVGGDLSEIEEAYEAHKSRGRGKKGKLAVESGDEAEEQADSEPGEEERWKPKEKQEDMFIVEHEPPTTSVKFTPSVVGKKKNGIDISDPQFESTTDAPSVAVKLPKGLADFKAETIVCFHPRQFHRAEVRSVFLYFFHHSCIYNTLFYHMEHTYI